MKIMYFIESGGPGGAEKVIIGLATELHRRGFDVFVLTLRAGWFTEQLDALGIRRIQLESKKRFDLRLVFRISKLIREEMVDIIHTHSIDSAFYGCIAAKLSGISHLATEHGEVHHLTQKKYLKTKLRIISLSGSLFTAVSKFTTQKLSALGVPAKKIYTIYNPLSPARPITKTREQIFSQLNLDQNEKYWIWLHVANLRPVKDQTTLLKGFAEACKISISKQILIILGEGSEKGNLQQLAKHLRIDDLVFFLGFTSEVNSYLQIANGFILSSISEAMPMSLLEAAEAGLTLVCSDVGGIGEVIHTGKTGFLFPAGDPIALSKILHKILVNPEIAKETSTQVSNFVRENFSVEKISSEYLSLYEKLHFNARSSATNL